MQPYAAMQNYGYNPYGNYQQQPLMPMQDRLSQLTQNYQSAMPQYQMPQQQPPMNFGLNGQMVDSIDVVKAKDVDLSGNPTFYPNVNGNEIYRKQLMADGTSQTITYRKVEQNDSHKETVQSTVNMDTLNNLIGQLKEDLLNEINGIKNMIPTLMSVTPETSVKSSRGGSQK